MNALKYNILVFGLIAVICLTVLFSGNMVASTTENSTYASSTDEGVEMETETSESDVEVPTFYNAKDCFEYAYNIYKNGKGFQSRTSQNVTNDYGVEQKIYVDKYKNSNGDFFSSTTSSGAENFYQALYITGDTVTYGKFEGSVTYPDVPSGLSITTQSFSSYYDDYNLVSNDFSCPVSNSTCKMTSFIRTKDRKGNAQYSFKIIYNDSAWTRYQKVMEKASSKISNVKISSITLDVVVDAKTGCFVSISSTEKYSVKAFGLNVNCQSSSIEYFTKMNKDVDLSSVNTLK